MVSDVGALTVALIALRLRHHKPNDGYTFGLRRAPVLGGLINAVALVAIAVYAIGTLALISALREGALPDNREVRG